MWSLLVMGNKSLFKRSRSHDQGGRHAHMVKTLKNLLLWNQKGRWRWNLVCSIGCSSTIKFVQMMWWPWINLDLFYGARSNFVPYAFVWEKGKTMDISETIVVCDVKVGRSKVTQIQHFQTSFPVKPLGRLKTNFMLSLSVIGERKFVQMLRVTRLRWPPCPYMVKKKWKKKNFFTMWPICTIIQLACHLFKLFSSFVQIILKQVILFCICLFAFSFPFYSFCFSSSRHVVRCNSECMEQITNVHRTMLNSVFRYEYIAWTMASIRWSVPRFQT